MKTNRKASWHGMNWIRQSTRLAIYLRDNLCCQYCGTSIEDDSVQLTLDHIVPFNSRRVNNSPMNLITCCHACNCSRGKRNYAVFAKMLAKKHDVSALAIIKRVVIQSELDLTPFRKAALEMIAKRGSTKAVLDKLTS